MEYLNKIKMKYKSEYKRNKIIKVKILSRYKKLINKGFKKTETKVKKETERLKELEEDI